MAPGRKRRQEDEADMSDGIDVQISLGVRSKPESVNTEEQIRATIERQEKIIEEAITGIAWGSLMAAPGDELNDTVLFQLDREEFDARNLFEMNKNGNIRVAAVNPPPTQTPQVSDVPDNDSVSQVTNQPDGSGQQQGDQVPVATQGPNVQIGSTMPPTMVPGIPGVWEFWWIPFMTVMILLVLTIVVIVIVKRRRSKRRRLSPFHEYEY